MKRIIKIPVVLYVLVVFLSSCTPKNQGGVSTIRLKYNHTVAETSSWHTYSLKFADMIKESTGNRYVVDVFANEQLASGSQAKTLEMLRAGLIDIDLHSTTIWAGIDDRFAIALMPWIMPDYDTVDSFLTGEPGQAFLQLVAENGCVPLALGENGYRQVLNTKKVINSPADMKDLKIRVPGMSMFVDFYRTLSADPTTMNWGEVFSALQQKTIDGMESPPEIIESGRFQEVNNYMTMWNANYDPLILSMSQKLWDSLNDNDRKIFVTAAKQAMNEQTEYQRKANETSANNLTSTLTINHLTQEQIKVFRTQVQPVYDKYRDIFPESIRRALNY